MGTKYKVLDSVQAAMLIGGLATIQTHQRSILESFEHYNLEKDGLARYGQALSIEVSEFLNETPWKVWKNKPADLDKIRDEFADVLLFTGTWLALLDLMGIPVEDIVEAIDDKFDINQQRFRGEVPGYGNPKDGYASDDGAESRIQAAVDSIYTKESVKRSNGYAQTLLPPEATLEVGRSIFGSVTGRISTAEPHTSPPPRPIPDVMDLAGGLEEDKELDPLYDSVAPLDDSDEEDSL